MVVQVVAEFERANQTHRLMVVDLAAAGWGEFCAFLEYWRKCPHAAFPRDKSIHRHAVGCQREPD